MSVTFIPLEYDVKELELAIALIDDETQEKIPDVSYNLKILDGQSNLILDTLVYTPEDETIIKIIPDAQASELSIVGTESYDGEKWNTSKDNKLQISGPIFQHGGLYQIIANVLSISEQNIPLTEANELKTLVTIGEFIPFEISYKDNSYDLTFATYYDKITEFKFDEKTNSVTAEMPFNWDDEHIKKIPFVHGEYYIPKTLDIFESHDIITTINGKEAPTMIDWSQKEEIVVHYLYHTKKLLKMAQDQSGEDLNRIVFGITSGEPKDSETARNSLHQDTEGKMIKMSSKNDWKLYFWWEPEGTLTSNNEITFNIMFHDPETDVMVKDVTYDFEIYQDGKLVESRPNSHTFSGHELQDFTFSKDGNVVVEIKNINGVNTGNSFEFKVASIINDDVISQSLIPQWVKNSAGWWAKKQINDKDFVSGIQFMIKQDIIKVPLSEKTSSAKSSEIPEWIRNNAKWWSDNQIDDQTFIQGIQYLVKQGIIIV